MSLAYEVAQLCGKASKTASHSGYYNCSCPAHTDKSASGGFKDGDKEGWIFPVCRAGCEKEDIYRALEEKGLYRRPEKGKKSKVIGIDKAKSSTTKLPEATYDYHDEQGDLLFQVRRWKTTDGKYFTQHKWDGEKYLEQKLDARPVLWKLPSVVRTASEGGLIFIPEGEKDVITLEGLGLVATTNAGGGNTKWDPTYTESLKGAGCVYLLPDNDATGEKHVNEVAVELVKAGITVIIVRLPGVKEKGDVTDWIEAGHNVAELLEIAGNTPEFEIPIDFTPPVDEPAQQPEKIYLMDDSEEPPGLEFQQPSFKKAIDSLGLGEYPDGDIANGKRLVKKFGNEIRYAIEGVFMNYRNGLWTPDCKEHTYTDSLAKKVVEGMRHEAQSISHLSSPLSKRLYAWAKKCNTDGGKISSMVKMARSESEVKVSLNDFDKESYLLNVKNGVIDLKTGKLLPHDRTQLHTKQIPFNYNEKASYEKWEKVLLEVFDGDWEMVMFFQRAIGLSLTGDTKEQKAFFLYGPGGNGKSLIMNRVLKLFGDGSGSAYSVTVRAKMFMQSLSENQTDNPGQLKATRLAAVGEINKRDQLNESFLKDATGDDVIKGRYLFSEAFSFWPQCKIWFRGNFLPTINDSTNSIWRRILIIPLLVKFDNPDKDLAAILDRPENLEGLLKWAVEGCLLWQQEGLKPPAAVTKATDDYRNEMDRIGGFLTDRVDWADYLSVSASKLYKAYREWCEFNGLKSESMQKFGRDIAQRTELSQNKVEKEHVRAGIKYRGMGLATIED